MKNIQGIEVNDRSGEEQLPDFASDFPYIATCAELDSYPEHRAPWHWHRAAELFYMESGCLEYTTPHGKWTFRAGCGGMVNSNVLHSTQWKVSEECNIQLLHLFDPSLISGGAGTRMEQKYVMPLVSSPEIELIPLSPEEPEQAEILHRIRQAFELSEEEWGYEFRLRNMLTEIWLDLSALVRSTITSGKVRDRSNEQIKRMMLYVQEHYSEHLTVDDLAGAAYISRRACFRLFRDNLHVTPAEYIRSCRLQKACQMLTKGNAQITEIALSCGLGSGSYFGRVFREEFGCTPLEYRRLWHNRDINRHQ